MERKIRLVHVINSLSYGGAENQVVQLLNGLNSCRFEKYLVTFRKVETANSRALSPDVSSFNLSLRRWGQPECILKLYRFFRIHKIHIAQAHMFRANLYVTIAGWLARVPVLLTTEHGKNLWKKPIHHLLEEMIISTLATMRVAVSKDILEIRVKSANVPRDKIMVIPNCVEVPNTKSRRSRTDLLRIGTVGRLVSAKDYGTLITSFMKLINQGFKLDLIFVGDGPERSRLVRKVQRLGLSEHVTFTGYQADVNSFLSTFDIFVLSSIREGVPVAMLEAMIRGLPVVATKVGGIPEIIQNNVDGLLVESQAPELIANALKRLIENTPLRKRIGDAGFRKAKRFFSREVICNQYAHLYGKLLERQ